MIPLESVSPWLPLCLPLLGLQSMLHTSGRSLGDAESESYRLCCMTHRFIRGSLHFIIWISPAVLQDRGHVFMLRSELTASNRRYFEPRNSVRCSSGDAVHAVNGRMP